MPLVCEPPQPMSASRLAYRPFLVIFTGVMAVTAMVLNGITWSRVTLSIEDVVVAQTERDRWESLLGTLKDAETGQRGYLITGDRSYLDPFEAANLRLTQDIAALKEITQHSPSDHAEVEAIAAMVIQRFDVMKEIRVVRDREGFEAAKQLLSEGAGKQLMDDLRQAIGEQIRRRTAISAQRAQRMTRDLRWGYASAIGAGVVAMGSGFVAFLLLRDALRHARRERRLDEAKRRAEMADKEKSAFLATMSHEIRTPMNAILGFAELLRDRLTGERERRYVDSILSGGRSLLQLINDILDLSKVEAGMLPYNPEPTDLRAAARFVQQLFQQLALQRGIDFRVEVDESLPRSLLFDHLRLRQVLINVIGNAMKFTESGRVSLRIHGKPEAGDTSRLLVIMEVEDTGCGIAEDQLERIFQPFVQAEASKGAPHPGTGLGLAIVQRLVHLMGGKITVRSERGRGTLFRFEFPGVAVSSRLPEPLSPPEDRDVNFNDFRASTLLIVDDNATNRELMVELFSGTRHRLILAGDGEAAVAAAVRESPDLVLMDVRMPKMDGIEALGGIRAEGELRLLPVVAVTASSLGEEDARIRRQFDAYLRKPFSRAELHAILAQFIPLEEQVDEAPVEPPCPSAPESPEMAQRWRRLVDRLEETTADVYPELIRTLSVPDISHFAQELAAQAADAECAPLATYAASLAADTESFSPDLLENSLKRFPSIMDSIRNASRSSRQGE